MLAGHRRACRPPAAGAGRPARRAACRRPPGACRAAAANAFTAAGCPRLAALGQPLGLYANEKVRLTEPAARLGRRLVAAEDIAGGELLLSLPLSSAIQVTEDRQDEHGLPWSLDMALTILERRLPDSAEAYGAWLAALPPPEDLALPITTFTDEEIQTCGQPDAIAAAMEIRAMLRDAAKGLAPDLRDLGASPAELAWAVGLAHSRSFVLPRLGGLQDHVIAPGIDMANHSFGPTATVKMWHSPEACQGRDAVEEVCEAPAGVGESCIQLLAAEQGLQRGEEVTIQYCSHPDEIFYCFYGFLPEANPHSSVVIFKNLPQLATFLEEETGIPRSLAAAHLPPEAAERLVVTDTGFDARAIDAVAQLLQLDKAVAGRDPLGQRSAEAGEQEQAQAARVRQAKRLLAARCAQLLAELRAKGAGSADPDEMGLSPGMRLSLALRRRKLRLLEQVLRVCKRFGYL